MTTGVSPAPPTGRPRPWDGAVLGTSALTVAVVALADPRPFPVGAVAAALGVFGLAWAAFGRRTLGGRRGWPQLVAVLAAVCFAGTLADPSFATFQVVALPIAWAVAPSVRSAVVANALVVLAVGGGWVLGAGEPFVALLVEGISFGFSLAMGFWITRIEALSDERARLLDELRAAQTELEALHRETGAAAERERLARELHDTIAQSLTAVAMLAERAAARHPGDAGLGVLHETAREALGETRGLVAATAPVGLDGGLERAVRVLGDRFERETGVRVSVHVAAVVPRELEVVLLRCAQEGLANVRKHAGARSVDVVVERDGADARLLVVDDGIGIAPAAAAGGAGFGLAGMRDRVGLVGGDLRVGPAAAGGTRLEIRLPVATAVTS